MMVNPVRQVLGLIARSPFPVQDPGRWKSLNFETYSWHEEEGLLLYGQEGSPAVQKYYSFFTEVLFR
jgi:hypothetical protein